MVWFPNTKGIYGVFISGIVMGPMKILRKPRPHEDPRSLNRKQANVPETRQVTATGRGKYFW